MTLLLFKFFSMCERGAARGRAAANPRLLLRELLLVFESVHRLPTHATHCRDGLGAARVGQGWVGRVCVLLCAQSVACWWC